MSPLFPVESINLPTDHEYDADFNSDFYGNMTEGSTLYDFHSKRATIYNSNRNIDIDFVPTERTKEYNDWLRRRQDIMFTMQRNMYINQPVSLTNEVDIITKDKKSKFRLVFVFSNEVSKVFVKYWEVNKRHLYWDLWEKDSGRFQTYEDFKNQFDPKSKIFKEIKERTKNDISRKVRDLLDSTNPFGTKKIDTNNIRFIDNTSTQNNINANRHRSQRILIRGTRRLTKYN